MCRVATTLERRRTKKKTHFHGQFLSQFQEVVGWREEGWGGLSGSSSAVACFGITTHHRHHQMPLRPMR